MQAPFRLPILTALALSASCNEYEVEELLPELAVSPEALEFMDVPLGGEETQQLTLANAGMGDLHIQGVETDAPFSATLEELRLAPGATVAVDIDFDASDDGSFTEVLTVLSDDPEQPAREVLLSAEVLPPDILVEPQLLEFPADGLEHSELIYITNQGEGPLVVYSVTLSDDGGGAYSLEDPAAELLLDAGSTETLPVLCSTDVYAEGELLLTSNDPDEPELSVALQSGEPNHPPTAPVVTIEPTSPREGQPFTCIIQTESTDEDGQSVEYRFAWELDGVEYEGATTTTTHDGDTIDGSTTVEGQEWTCIVTPSDGIDDGEPGTAAAVIDPPCGVNPSDGLVAYWSFDEGAGDLSSDSSGNGYDGQIEGASWAEGACGGALEFDGTDDYVDLGDVFNELELPLSFSAWVWRSSDTDSYLAVLDLDFEESLYTGIGIGLSTGDWYPSIYWGDGRGDCSSSYRHAGVGDVAADAEQWVHVAGVARGTGDIALYLDGEALTVSYQGSSSYGPGFTDAPASLGRLSGCAFDYYTTGILDEVRIYDRELTAEEIVGMADVDLSQGAR